MRSKSDPDIIYFADQFKDGHWECECLAYQINKQCRHIRLCQQKETYEEDN